MNEPMESTTLPTDWETSLAELLRDLSETQQQLLEVLQTRRDAMLSGDLEQMHAVQQREEEVQQLLLECHQRRQEMLDQASDAGLPGDSIQTLAAAVAKGPRGPLARQASEAQGRMRLLQHHSLTNWVVAQQSVLHLSQMLEIIATGGRLQPTYGKAESVNSRGSLVDRAV